MIEAILATDIGLLVWMCAAFGLILVGVNAVIAIAVLEATDDRVEFDMLKYLGNKVVDMFKSVCYNVRKS